MITLEEINTFAEFRKLAPLWNPLLASSDVNIPFLTHEWLSCWWQSFGGNNTLRILVARDTDSKEITGIAPCMTSRMNFRGIPIGITSLMANAHSNRSGIILAARPEETLTGMVEYLLKQKGENVVRLDYLAEGTSTQILDAVLGQGKYRSFKKESLSSPYIRMEGGWENYVQQLSRELRKNIRRRNNLIKKAGRAEVVNYARENISRGLEEMLTISRNTWKFRKHTAIASSERDTSFYAMLARKLAEKSWLDLAVLKLENKPIAFEYNVVYANKVYSLKVGYDERYKHLSPSVLLSSELTKQCFNEGRTEYDLLGEAEPFKLWWTPFCRQHFRYYIFGQGIYAQMLYGYEKNIVRPLRTGYKKIFGKKQPCLPVAKEKRI